MPQGKAVLFPAAFHYTTISKIYNTIEKLHGNHLKRFVEFVVEYLLHRNGFENIHIDNLIVAYPDDTVADPVL